jgi:capsular exopolysaccharide synthesis family protein
LLTALGAAVGVVVARHIRPLYDVHATLWISSDARSNDRGTGLVNGSSWVDLLRSYAILERVARRAHMQVVALAPEERPLFAGLMPRDSVRTGSYVLHVADDGTHYTLRSSRGATIEAGQLGDSVGRALGFQWVPPRALFIPSSDHRFIVQTLRDAANDISERLATVQPDGTSFIRLTLSGADPKSTAVLLNMITEEFISVSAELKKRSVVAQSERLSEQVRSAQASLRAAESALERFRVASATLPGDENASASRANTSDPLLARYLNDQAELEGLQRDRVALEGAIAQLRANDEASATVLAMPVFVNRAPEVRAAVVELDAKRVALAAVRRQYTDEHRVVRELRDAERELQTQTIPRLAAARIDQMRKREAELETSVTTTARSLESIPPRALEELRLRRNVTLAEELFSKVQNEFEAAGLAAAGMVADVSVLDPAVAPLRAPPGRARQIAALCTFAGLFAGVFGALLLDATDKRLRYTSQIGEDMELSILGSLPRLSKRRGNSLEKAQLVEGLRGIRVGVAYALGGQTPMQLTVSSPNMGDGKSLVSTNLAISFAEAGYRTLLIDGDIRRGSQHDTFGVPRRPGLMDCLAADVPMQDVVTTTGIPRLSLIPCGTRYRQGPEFLAGPGLSSLLAEARNSYDVVIVDSPPLSLGADALWESIATGSLVLVLRMNASNRHLAKSSLSSVDRLPINVIGAIVNASEDPVENEYYQYLSDEAIDVDTMVPQRTSQIGVLSSAN